MNLNFKQLTLAIFAALLVQAAFAQTKPGVQTEHGYRFVNHTNKPGVKAQSGETVVVQVATFVGDSLMASTRNSGGAREFKLFEAGQLPPRVPPLYDAVLLMTKGDSATIYQPIDSTIRTVVPEPLRKETEVRYEITLVDLITKADLDKKMAEGKAKMEKVKTQTEGLAKDFREGKLANQLKKTASGLQYIIHEPGTGGKIEKASNVKAHYYGALPDGSLFDTSFERGQALAFSAGVGQMIPGFDEGAQLLQYGGKATLFIPYALAYGEEGTPGGPIPPKTDLIFYIEVEK